ncbi:hypothetical protein CLIB1423_01S02630 [[Candida] railenensis]|uniref:Uncharacterized protein n=1 Tax=[Candida] railenensis TaxID=45579 RepID=A0A9P0QKG9_9ASCO|nr:hypothetical protein CLIB1423_01S02630 [[Candida] railenensis]
MESLFDAVWSEITLPGSLTITVDQLPILIHSVERHLMKITGLQSPPITNDAHVTSEMNHAINKMTSTRKENLLSRKDALSLINKLLVDIKIIDIDSKLAYGDFNDDFEFYQDHLNNLIIKDNNVVNQGSNSSRTSIVSDFEYEYDYGYEDEEDDLDSIMDMGPLTSSSPSIYDVDPPINHYIRDSLFEINKHHLLIKSKFLYSELLLKDIKQQSGIDLQLLKDLNESNDKVSARIGSLRQELMELSDYMGIEMHEEEEEEEEEEESDYQGSATSDSFSFEIPKSDEFIQNWMLLPKGTPINAPTNETSSTIILFISIFILILSYILSI